MKNNISTTSSNATGVVNHEMIKRGEDVSTTTSDEFVTSAVKPDVILHTDVSTMTSDEFASSVVNREMITRGEDVSTTTSNEFATSAVKPDVILHTEDVSTMTSDEIASSVVNREMIMQEEHGFTTTNIELSTSVVNPEIRLHTEDASYVPLILKVMIGGLMGSLVIIVPIYIWARRNRLFASNTGKKLTSSCLINVCDLILLLSILSMVSSSWGPGLSHVTLPGAFDMVSQYTRPRRQMSNLDFA